MNKQNFHRLPQRIDYLVLAVNEEETQSVLDILGLTKPSMEEGYYFNWGNVKRRGGSGSAVVVFHSLIDVKGCTNTASRVSKIVPIIRPKYILLLGSAGGISPNIEIGDINIGRIIYYGVLRANELSPEIIHPRSQALYDCANNEVIREQWKKQIQPFELPVDPNISIKSQLKYLDHISTEALMEESNKQPVIDAIHAQFRKAATVDMEAGGLGTELHQMSSRENVPEYLIIKCVTDIINNLEVQKEKQTEIRKAMMPIASRMSAQFAKLLIEQFSPPAYRPTHIRRFIPEKQVSDFRINEDLSGILYSITPKDYSLLAAHNSNKLTGIRNTRGTPFLFTVCAYNPKSLWDAIEDDYYRVHRYLPSAGEKQIKYTRHAIRSFNHFHQFRKMAKRNSGAVIRLLIIDEDYWTAGLTDENWTFFRQIMDGVPCCGVIRPIELQFMSDYLLIGRRLLMDYYPNSSILAITELGSPSQQKYFLELFDQFVSWKNGKETYFSFLSLKDVEQLALKQLTRDPN